MADTDNDGDLDLIINGNTQNLLYINNGAGLFSSISTNLQQTFAGKNAFADLDNDGDQDLLIVGSQAGGLPNIFNIVYRNDGNNTFVQTQILGGEYIADCVIADFNGDGLKDIIIQGFADDTNVYWNTSTVLGISEQIVNNNSIIFYPNPAKDFINLILKDESLITIYNSVGQIVFTKKMNSNDFIIDISNLTNGVYIIKLNENGNSKTAKFIKH